MSKITLLHGDAREVLRDLTWDPTTTYMVTDPPYGIDGGRGGDSRKYGKGKYEEGNFSDTPEYIRDVIVPMLTGVIGRVTAAGITPGKRCHRMYPEWQDEGVFWVPAGVTHSPWGLSTDSPILYYGRDWRAGKGPKWTGRQMRGVSWTREHPCAKPIVDWKWLVDKIAPHGSTVIDPLMGVGTTAICCWELDIDFIGIELCEEYYQFTKTEMERRMKQPKLFVMGKPEQTELSI